MFFKYFSILWYSFVLLLIIYNPIKNYFTKSIDIYVNNISQNIYDKLHVNTTTAISCHDDHSAFYHKEHLDYSKLPSPPKKPFPKRLYLLSNPNNHVFTLALMDTYDTIKHFIFIDFDKARDIFCKRVYISESKILSSLVENDRRYYALKNYGNSYFFDPGFEIINIMRLELQDC